MKAKTPKNVGKGFSQKVLDDITSQKDPKVAKTFSIKMSNYQALKDWCVENNEKPSTVIDSLLKVFLDETVK